MAVHDIPWQVNSYSSLSRRCGEVMIGGSLTQLRKPAIWQSPYGTPWRICATSPNSKPTAISTAISTMACVRWSLSLNGGRSGRFIPHQCKTVGKVPLAVTTQGLC